MATVKFWNSCNGAFKILLIIIIVFGVVVPLFIQISLLMQQSIIKDDSLIASRKAFYVDIEQKTLQVNALEAHLSELEAIRMKALTNLLGLDEKRVKLQTEIHKLTNEKLALEKEHRSYLKLVGKLKKQAEFAKETRQEKVIQKVIHVGVPKQQQEFYQQQPLSIVKKPLLQSFFSCNYENCFDYSKCSILQSFHFYIYEPKSTVLTPTYELLQKHSDNSMSPKNACIYLALVTFKENMKDVNKFVTSLPFWKQTDGRNHIVFLIDNGDENYCSNIQKLERGNAILVLSIMCENFHNGFDLILPRQDNSDHTELPWKYLPALYPIKREYILFFHSEFRTTNRSSIVALQDILGLGVDTDVYAQSLCNDQFITSCTKGWCQCGPLDHRRTLQQSSTFTLIVIEKIEDYFFNEILEAFKNGAIPVLLGSSELIPFSNLIDWSLACVIFSSQRLPELLFVLRTMPVDDMVSMKRQGRFLYETYFSSFETSFDTVLTALRNNIGLPASMLKDVHTNYIDDIAYSPDTSEFSIQFPSVQMNRNFSYIGRNSYISWNKYPGGLNIYPVIPWNDVPPSRIQFIEEGKDSYMPIGDGKGGDGVAFSRSLGGDYPIEQFTVLMLTYDRESILMEALQRLSGLKYVNKVIVLWNHPIDPAKDLSWPDIGVKMEVIRTGKNSLNNRFVPYDAIETEAILSVDDDIYLRHDEIELAFRVWRENRDRLVGFPGRHHSYNTSSSSFYYNAEHSCELSLVLTGAAFFHKYYSYMYTYQMPSAIREMVDNYMNCEDIAMNFLIAHTTQKPPIKVTSRWTFRCPGCPDALSSVADHYQERNKCMRFFETVFGYNSLKRTQFRADSILFKTRLPATMTKCFQFV